MTSSLALDAGGQAKQSPWVVSTSKGQEPRALPPSPALSAPEGRLRSEALVMPQPLQAPPLRTAFLSGTTCRGSGCHLVIRHRTDRDGFFFLV